MKHLVNNTKKGRAVINLMNTCRLTSTAMLMCIAVLVLLCNVTYVYSQVTCDGVLATDPLVCSSHGFCIATDTCVCHDNYKSPSCAVRRGGHLFSAGSNTYRQLGEPVTAASYTTMIRVGDYLGLMRVESVSSGDTFSLALTTKGEVFAWGQNQYGQLGLGVTSAPQAIPSLLRGGIQNKRIVSIAACMFHGLAADSDGNVYAWGTNTVSDELGRTTGGWLGVPPGTSYYSPTKVNGPAEMQGIIKVRCGKYHSMALTSTNSLFSWGGNWYGQLGLGGSASSSPTPQQVFSMSGGAMVLWTDMALGEVHSAGMDTKGKIFTWGASDWGQIGDGNPFTATQASPYLVSSVTPVRKIAASRRATFAVLADGSIMAWGNNANGELGNSTAGAKAVSPVLVALMMGVTVKSIFSEFSADNVYAVASDDSVYGWGYNSYGQFGIGATGTNYAVRQSIGTPFSSSVIVKVAPGSYHSVYLIDSTICFSIFKTDSLVCSKHGNCTANDVCECRDGYTGPDCSLPICYGLNSSDPVVCSGHGQCLTINTCVCYQGYSGQNCESKDEGFLYASGDNSYGQLADNLGKNSVSRMIPIVSSAFTGSIVNSAASGVYYSLILLASGMLYSVGLNNFGQLGDGTKTNRASPVMVQGIFNGQVVSMCAGYRHSLVVDNVGGVWSFGDNSYGQLGTGDTTQVSTPIQVGGALTNERVVAVACGMYHSVAMIKNGTILAWGYNYFGQLGDGTSTSKYLPQTVQLTGLLYKRKVAEIAAGSSFTMAIADDGTVYRWGENTYGQLADGSTTHAYRAIALTTGLGSTQVTGIAAGIYSSYVISNHSLYAAGSNSYGQLGIGSVAQKNTYQQVITPLASRQVAQVYVGMCDSGTQVGAVSDSIAFVWGNNEKGQLGDGTNIQRNAPNKYHIYFPAREVESISVGCYHTLVVYSITKSCFGVLADEPSVCSYHGNCTSFDQCVCENGYSGVNCDYFECNGFSRANSSVCSGRGICSGLDVCLCDTGYSGSNCEKTVRGITYSIGRSDYGVLANDDVPAIGYSMIPLLTGGIMSGVVATKVDGGSYFSIALSTAGDLYTWGNNANGQLGDGSTTSNDRPRVALSNVLDCCAGAARVVAITRSGAVIAWGSYVVNTGTSTTKSTITGFDVGDIPKSVACGGYHSLILTAHGNVYSFGHGAYGQLGFGSTSNSWTAQKVLGLKNIAQVAAGDSHSLALGIYGEVYSWGRNNMGQLADTTTTDKNVPVLATGAITQELIVQIASSMQSSYAVTNEGKVYSWGSNANGLLGDASAGSSRTLPGMVKNLGGSRIEAVYGSRTYNWIIAVNSTGAGYAWGINNNAQLGDDTAVNRPEPVPQLMNKNYPSTYLVGVGTGYTHSVFLLDGIICFGKLAQDPRVCSWRGRCVDNDQCECDAGYFGTECSITSCYGVFSNQSNVCSGRGACIAQDVCSCTNGQYSGSNCEVTVMGYIYGTGKNTLGQLGDDLQIDRSVLVMTALPLSTNEYMRYISAGVDFSLAISTSGELFTWGSNANYNLGDGTKTTRIKPMQLMTDKTFISASAAQYHAVAVTTDGRVFSWGDNTFNGVTSFNYRTRFCCYYYSTEAEECTETACCIATYPRFCDVGPNPTILGYLGLGPSYYYSATPRQVIGFSGVAISVSCGVYHCLLLTVNGEVWAWGDNTFGQLGNGDSGANMQQYSPVRVAYSLVTGGTLSGVKIVSIAAGSYHSMALSSMGEVYVWGSNNNGQIGDGIVRSSNLSRYPKMIIQAPIYRVPIKTIFAGTSSSYVVSSNNTVFAWGRNNNYQLGINSTMLQASTPINLNNQPSLSVISSNRFGVSDFVIAADLNGDGYGWGLGSTYQLVNGITSPVIAPQPMLTLYANPVTLSYTNRSIVAVAAGTQHSLLLLNGTYCYGLFSDDPYVCSGRGTCVATDTCVCPPEFSGEGCSRTTCYGVNSTDPSVCSGVGVCVSNDACVCSMGYTGAYCHIWLYGEVYSIGNNDNGQLGDDYYLSKSTIARTSYPLSYGEPVKFIDAGIDFTVAISRRNKLYVWGNNAYYNLGIGSTTTSLRPYLILPGHAIVSACAGQYHGVAVNSTGYVFAWGSNTQDGRMTCLFDSPTRYCTSTSCACSDAAYVPPKIGNLGLGASYFFTSVPQQVSLPEPIVSVSCGIAHTVATGSSGKLYSWGAGSYGQLGIGDWINRVSPVQVGVSAPTGNLFSTFKAIQIATGFYHSIALGTKGDIYTWGYNNKGQLGHGTLTNSRHPVQVLSTIHRLPIIQVAAGNYASYALTSVGEVYAWGDNSNGQLGINSTVPYVVIPTLVPGLTSVNISSLGTGSNTVIAVGSNGEAYSWGLNTNSQAIDGSIMSKKEPTRVNIPFPSRKIVAATTGNVFSVLILNTTYCFGYPFDDVMACSTRGNCTDTDKCECADHFYGEFCQFTTCNGYNNTDSQACSGQGSCVNYNTCQCTAGYTGKYCDISVFGSLRMIGRNNFGQLGNGYITSSTDFVKTYEPLKDGTLVQHIVSGVETSFAITPSGELYSWGNGIYGKLGKGGTSDILYPARLFLSKQIISVCSGSYHSVAVSSTGEVFSWGVNTIDGTTTGIVAGQMGIGTIKYSYTPSVVSGISGTPISVACGQSHTIVLTKEGAVFGFGDDSTNGAVGYGLGRYETTPVRVGESSPIKGLLIEVKIVAIAAGQYHSMALGSKGEVYTWGDNSKGQLGDSTIIANRHPRQVMGLLFRNSVVQINAGAKCSYAITFDGTLLSWGENDVGQLGINSTINQYIPTVVSGVSNVATISAGTWSKYALVTTTNGLAFGFGDNSYSKIGDGTSVTRATPVPVINQYNSSFYVAAAASTSHSMFLLNGTFCFGILSDDENVCSTRGTCVAENKCVCNDGYFGPDCSTNMCFGLNQSDLNVCSGHGSCVALDSCACRKYYSGLQCEKPIFGVLYTLGDNTKGQLGDDYYDNKLTAVQPAYPLTYWKSVKHVSSGIDISFALTTEGELYSWGQSTQWVYGNASVGLLGDGTFAIRNRPAMIMTNIVHMCVSTYHVAVVDNNNTIYTWGINTVSQQLSCTFTSAGTTYTYPVQNTTCPCPSGCPATSGILGNSQYYWSNSPIMVNPPANSYSGAIVELACGAQHTLALTSNGYIYGWGQNTNSQLGSPAIYGTYVQSPVLLHADTSRGEILGNKRVISIDAGDKFSIVLTDRGKVYVWGENLRGTIADGTLNPINAPFPMLIQGLFNNRSATQISAASQTAYAITEDEQVTSWGDNSYGQLGINSTAATSAFPVTINDLTNVSLVSANLWSSSVQVTTRSGVSYSWGSNAQQNLGLNVSTPIIRYPLNTNRIDQQVSFIVSFGTGNRHSLLIYNGTYCDGVLADDPKVCSYRGICVEDNFCVCDFRYSGSNCSIAECYGLTSDNPLVCSGNGRCLFADTCVCDSGHFGLMCNGKDRQFLYASGDDSSSQLGDGFFVSQNYPRQASLLALTTINYIAAGEGSSYAVSHSEGIFAFGNNDYGQLGDNTTFTRYFPVQILPERPIIRLVACSGYTLAIDSNSNVYSWGLNTFGQLGTGKTLQSLIPVNITQYFGSEKVIDIACGQAHSLALSSSGRVFSWGRNTYGELGRGISGGISMVPQQIQGLLNIKRITSVAAGQYHSLALNEDGTVYTWGRNNMGQLGDGKSGASYSRSLPFEVRSGGLFGHEPVMAIAAGIESSYALLLNGTLYSWGSNTPNRQLGDNSIVLSRNIPAIVPFQGEYPITSISVGKNSNFAIALASNGTAYGWGQNTGGQLGDYTFTSRNYSSAVGNTKPQRYITSVSTGSTHSLFLFSGISCFGIVFDDPTVCSWRGNCTDVDHCECPPSYGGRDCSVAQCFDVNATDPNVCSGGGRCVSLDTCVCFQGYSGRKCEVASLGYLYSSGQDSYSQLGSRGIGFRPTVERASMFATRKINLIVPAYQYSLVKTLDGQVYTWGLNTGGQLGDNTTFSNGLQQHILAESKIIGLCGGVSHAMALEANGTVFAWGSNQYGQIGINSPNLYQLTPTPVTGELMAEEIVAIACGGYHSMALTLNGSVYTWGFNLDGELGDNSFLLKYTPIKVAALLNNKRIVQITAGKYHSMALGSDGTVYSWGKNDKGQLGDSTKTNKFLPVQVPGLLYGKPVSQITAGESFSMAIASDGKVYSWGANNAGQLGDGTTVDKQVPTEVTILPSNVQILTISAGGSFAHAIADNQTAFSWGDNTFGQLGNNDYNITKTPWLVQVQKQFPTIYPTAAVAGDNFSFYLFNGKTCFSKFADDPTVCSTKGNCTAQDYCSCDPKYNAPDCSTFHCFGYYPNDTRTCSGRGACLAADSCVCRPGYIGEDCSQAVNGYVFVLGKGSSGQLGNGYTFSQILPAPVTGDLFGQVVSHVTSGQDFSIAITAFGRVYGWGVNDKGQLGDSTTTTKLNPTAPVGLDTIHVVTGCAGRAHTVVVDSDGRVYSWGTNYRGQLGNGDVSLTDKLTPTLITTGISGKKVVQAVCGEAHTAVLIDDGTIYAWGLNSQGQLGNGDNWPSLVPVQVGVGVIDHIPILRIASGWNHMMGIGPFGVIYIWGSNSFGQLGDSKGFDRYSPTPVLSSDFKGRTSVYIEGSEESSYAVFSDGSVFAWGGTSQGQLGSNITGIQGIRSPIPISDARIMGTGSVFAGRNYAFALKLNGSAYSWGYNTQGQIGDGSYLSTASPVPVANHYSIRYITHIAPSSEHTVFLYNGTSCFGFLADDENVCSGRGRCVSDDVCACTEQFSDKDCSVNYCNGVRNTDPLVCSGNGVCIPNNTCVCQPNYRGTNCNETRFGYLFSMGDGSSGQLGDGRTINTNVIIKARASLNRIPIRHVSAGRAFSIALTVDGKLYSVGTNTLGQLGDGTFTSNSTPILTTFTKQGLAVSSIAVGYSSVVVTTPNGTLYAWGSNQQGQLGLGTDNTQFGLPKVIGSLLPNKVSFASCGMAHCLALSASGELYSWGSNSNGQLGDGTLDTLKSKLLPIRVLSIFGIKKASTLFAGASHSLATTVDGVLYSWGDDSRCQLGQGSPTSLSSVPIPVKGLGTEIIQQVSGGEFFSCALTLKNQVWCWGANDKGQLGLNSTTDKCYPTRVESLTNYTVVRISSGGGSTFALTDSGMLFAWGINSDGQLGLGSTTNKKLPELVGSQFTQRKTEYMSPGVTHSMILYNGTTCFSILQDDPDVCSGNGTCTDWDTCVCKPGFSGTNCEFTSCFGYNMTDVANVCTGRGECRYLNTCICDPNKWSGDRCQYINCFGFLSNDPQACSSKGQCIGPGLCNCTHGYNGDRCQYTICHGRNTNDPLVCSGQGMCYSPDVCMCYTLPVPGYTGGNCSYPICRSRYFDRITGIETIYQAPETSTDLILSTAKDCSAHGKCTAPGKCQCNSGFTDAYCSTPICFGLNATNPASCNYGKNGTCIAPNNCTCLTKLDLQGNCVPLTCYGKNLTTVPPACNSQLNQGNCINSDLCVCLRGYGGLECEQNVCYGILEYNYTQVCHGRGNCTQPDKCECQTGYKGTECQYIDCYGKLDVDHSVCSTHGVCSSPQNCVCDDGYTGNECQYPICYGKLSNDTLNVCSNHGECVAPDTCECHYGYYGLDCFYPSCFGVNTTDPEVCSTHGSCYKPDKCNCTDGWVSRDCSIPRCYGVWGTNSSVCSRYGFCYEPEVCLCSEGRLGLNCELNNCFGFNETDELACHHHGQCVAPHKCNCSMNEWTGYDCNIPICFGITATNLDVCSGRGSCIYTDTCQCGFGRTGAKCEFNVCFSRNETDPMVCSGHGDCYSVDKCNCTYGWKGADCSEPICFGIPYDHRDTCSGVGSCVYADSCNCSRTFGRTGLECQLSMCYGTNETDASVCSANGTCIGVDKCQCIVGRTGDQCQLNVCYSRNETDSLVCSGNGHCVSPDTCVCLPEKGYTGKKCDIPICYGYSSTDPRVCSSNGTCSSPNNCTCRTGRVGDECEVNMCFGLNGTDQNVCSGHGQCTMPDECRCSPEYTGHECQTPICFGISGTNDSVCSYFGDCKAPDTCACKNGTSGIQCEVCPFGYVGDMCRVVRCYGQFSNNSFVCSGHGSCVTPDHCSCYHGYVADECNIPICHGFLSNDTNVCSGKGSCIAPDRCLCDARFSGVECEIVKSQCESSGEFLLVSLPQSSSQNISLVDINCGKSMYSFTTMNSSNVFYNTISKLFYLLREDGLYSVSSQSLTLLRVAPKEKIKNLNEAAVFVEDESLVIVSLVDDIKIHCLDWANSNADKVYSTNNYYPLIETNSNRFATIDWISGDIYILARKSTNKVVILKVTSGTFSELITFKTFPAVEEVQGIIFVDGAVHVMRRTYLSKVNGDQLTLVSDLFGGFFAHVKYETRSHIYLQDTTNRLLMFMQKNKTVDFYPLGYPQDLIDKSFSIIGHWTPRAKQLSPSGVPEDSLNTTWITLEGQYLMLDGQSKITLTDPISNVTATAQLVNCSTLGLSGDACFKPDFTWPSDVGSVEFTEIVLHSVSNSTVVPQQSISLVYFKPEIVRLSATTAYYGDIISIHGPWFAIDRNISCNFVWKKVNGGEMLVDESSYRKHQRSIECKVPHFEGANNERVQVTVTMLDRKFSSGYTPAFFYYLETESVAFYDSFDNNSLTDVFEIPKENVVDWTPFDRVYSRSLSRITSHLSDSQTRGKITSKAPLVNTNDQQIMVEFIIETKHVGNLLELWHISANDSSFSVLSSIGVNTAGTQTLSISYQLGDRTFHSESKECTGFKLGVSHIITLALVRPEIEMLNTNETLFNEWLAGQNITTNTSNPIPDEPWRIDVNLKQGYSHICSVSLATEKNQVDTFKQMLSVGHLGIAQSIPSHIMNRKQSNSLSTNTSMLIDRIWIACQYSICNMTKIPKHLPSTTTPKPEHIQQYSKNVVVAISSVAASLFFLMFIAAIIPMILFVFWQVLTLRKKKGNHSKLDAWKFEFALDKNVSSLEDDQFAIFARKMHKVKNEDENKLKSIISLRRFGANNHVRDLSDSADMSYMNLQSSADSDAQPMNHFPG